MSENSIPVSIGKAPTSAPEGLAEVLGISAADVMGLYMSVIDREDRLESGTGEWLATFRDDGERKEAASRESVLRTLRMASDATNYEILMALSDGIGTPVDNLIESTGLTRLALAERLGDLVSSGLAAKLPEANQIVGTPAGSAVVRLVEAAATQAARLGDGG